MEVAQEHEDAPNYQAMDFVPDYLSPPVRTLMALLRNTISKSQGVSVSNDFQSPQFPPPTEGATKFVPVVNAQHVAWPKRKWLKLPLWAWISVGVLAVGAIGSAADPKKDNTQPAAASATDAAVTLMPTTVPATTVPATTVPATTVPATTVPATTVPATTVPATTPPPTPPPTTLPPVTSPPVTVAAATLPPPPPTIGETVSQKNARQSGASYLDFTAFSRSGLIHQLEFEGFTTEDATYGVDALTVDWNEQAAKSAAAYLDFTAFSRSGLIHQLVFEGFSQEQAEYGVSTTGL